MSEVRKSLGLGLFATKMYKPGEVILKENPMIQLESSSKHVSSIEPPSSIATHFRATFCSMVQVGLGWIQHQDNGILNLYFPTKESSSGYEKGAIKVAKDATEYIRNHKADQVNGFQDWETLEKVMLVWACNAFQGGRIYKQISRVNHSCNPNSIIQADGEAQRLVAATDIAEGEEITISYLGSILYTDTVSRNERLQKTKFFECKCDRCTSTADDNANRIPCPTCHPRSVQYSLEEDVQYDDDQTVKYVTTTGVCPKCQTKLDNSDKLCITVTSVSSKILAYLESQESSASNNNDDEEILEEHISLASTIMGDKHWTTNLLLLLYLDRRLSDMSSAMLTTQEIPEMEDVAEAIDTLQRVSRFVESLKLKLDPGHLLSDVIIGIGRTLVSLGDAKSQKYGAEWLDKIYDYVETFESEGRQKVVSKLRVAWKAHEQKRGSSEDMNKTKKKFKSAF